MALASTPKPVDFSLETILAECVDEADADADDVHASLMRLFARPLDGNPDFAAPTTPPPSAAPPDPFTQLCDANTSLFAALKAETIVSTLSRMNELLTSKDEVFTQHFIRFLMDNRDKELKILGARLWSSKLVLPELTQTYLASMLLALLNNRFGKAPAYTPPALSFIAITARFKQCLPKDRRLQRDFKKLLDGNQILRKLFAIQPPRKLCRNAHVFAAGGAGPIAKTTRDLAPT